MVTIQPGEMVFTTPAPLSLPNLAGYEPGSEMDLWSINPETGLFDNVGTGRVSDDGSVIETIEGGIRNSSWHFFAPPPPPPDNSNEDLRNPDDTCNECKVTAPGTSSVELHSGAVRETHELVSYQSMGVSSGLTLNYDSLRADPRPILNFGYSNVRTNQNQRLVAELTIELGNFDVQVPGWAGGQYGLNGGEHIWSLPNSGARIDAALQADLSGLASGRYDYQLATGLLSLNNNTFSGSTNSQRGKLLHVNSIGSIFGNGWGLGGLQQIVESVDRSVLLVDGDGGELLFEALPTGAYDSPLGDASTLEKLADGTFRRTMKDKTVYTFNEFHQLASMKDRVGNETQYLYNDSGNLIKIIDPVGLETNFTYTQGKVTLITTPGERETFLEYDEAGNLIKIIDPDGTYRSWSYDAERRMTGETDKRGLQEQMFYDEAGRAKEAIRKDLSVVEFDPVQVQGLYPPNQTIDPLNAPIAKNLDEVPTSTYIDANGNSFTNALDRFGQTISASDGEGRLPSVVRNEENLVTMRADARGFETEYTYDERGNLIKIVSPFKSSNATTNTFPFQTTENYSASSRPSNFAVGDVNGDGTPDLIINSSQYQNDVSLLLGNGDGTLGLPLTLGESYANTNYLVLGDLNSDKRLDLITVSENVVSVSLGHGDGTFSDPIAQIVNNNYLKDLVLGDLNGDGKIDAMLGDSEQLSAWFGAGDGTFVHSEDYSLVGDDTASNLVLEDLDGDARLDLAFVVGSGYGSEEFYLSVMFGSEQGRFLVKENYRVEAEFSAIDAGDLDNDGDLELVIGNRERISVWSNQGNRTLRRSFDLEVSSKINAFTIGDVNGDGYLDAVVANSADNTLSVFKGNGDASLTPLGDLTADDEPKLVALSDLDLDGDLDLIATNSRGSNNISVSLNGDSFGTVERRYTYDPVFNQLTGEIDELGRQTLYEIDPDNGNLLSVTKVVGAVGGDDDVITRYTYTAKGLIDTSIDPQGRITDYDYDSLGRLISTTYAVGTSDEARRQFEYDAAGNLTALINENGNRTEYQYDALNRLMKVVEADPDGNGVLTSPVTTYTYDANGNLLTTTDGEGNVINQEYDVLNRLSKTTDALNQSTTYTYDGVGNLLTVVDPLGNKIENVYDERNRLIQTIDPDKGITRFSYDLDNNLISVSDPVNNQTTFTYDTRGRLIRETDPLGKVTQYKYDAVNNLIAQIDRNKRRTEFEYDDMNRLTGETWVGTDMGINYIYDKASNLTSVVDKYSSLTYIYDRRDRVLSVDNLGTPNAPNIILNYTYDDVGNILSATDTINGVVSGTNNYAYDALNRLIQITQRGNDVSDKRVNFGYNANGQYTSINRYSNLTESQLVNNTTYSYDSLNRLTNLTHSDETDNVAFYNYVYDASSRITQITDLDGVTNYTYDDRDQLTGTNNSNTNKPDETYSYDANGNRTNTGYQTGANNRLLSDGTYNYEYDSEGNLIKQTEIITGTIREFEWDYRNRLITVTDKNSADVATQRVEFTYDAFDRRIAKEVDTTPLDTFDGIVTHFVYSGDDVHLEFVDNDGSGDVQSPILEQRYLQGAGVDEVLAQEDGEGNVIWMLTDHLGTVKDLVDRNGTLINHIIYDSFGEVIFESDPSVDSRYLFTGREFDSEIGLYYYRARYYDEDTGRFISEDPISFSSGDENLYRYVENNPINLTDPLGLEANSRYPLGHDHPDCKELAKQIEQLDQEIAKRIGEKHENPLGLPGKNPNDRLNENPRSSQRGHQNIIDFLKAKKAEKVALYQARCGEYPPPCEEEENPNNEFQFPDWLRWLFGIPGRLWREAY